MSTLVEMLRRRARGVVRHHGYTFETRDREAQERLSFETLDQRAGAIAARLRRVVQPGDRVVLSYGPGLDFVQAFCGCLYAGVIAVPCQPPRPSRDSERFRTMAVDAEPVFVLTGRATEPQLRPLCDSLGLPCFTTEDLKQSPEEPGWEFAPDPTDIAYLQYTSGSTSTPYGVMITHQAVLANLADIDLEFERRTRRIVLPFPGCLTTTTWDLCTDSCSRSTTASIHFSFRQPRSSYSPSGGCGRSRTTVLRTQVVPIRRTHTV